MLTRSEALFATLCCRNHVCVRRTEWQSQLLGRYQRRTHRVDEAILGVDLAGANTRRIRLALAPLLRGGPLSKDAVSRLVGRLRADFVTWRQYRRPNGFPPSHPTTRPSQLA